MVAASATKAIRLGHPSYVWRRGQDRRLALIRQYVELRAKRILDIGCGLGMYVSRFRQFSDDVYGIDVDPDKIGRASEWLPNLQVSPAEELPFDSGSFDIILLNEVIEHVDDDRRTIQEAYRVLAPGGHIIVYAPNRLYPFETHGFYFAGKYHGPCNLPILANWVPNKVRDYFAPHVRIYTGSELSALFEGLDVEFVVRSHIFPGCDNWAERGTMGRLFRDLMHLVENSPLRRFGISHFLVVRKRG
ncbi:MAG: class I SAM-dependent methyltransferase [Chloroflexota bacterium]|nr:class I SAM-dependent methyltransferase [Chloroflexota bacterium]